MTTLTASIQKAPTIRESEGFAHCPMCTHTVPAHVVSMGKASFTKHGQKCPRCGGTLDAAYVIQLNRAA